MSARRALPFNGLGGLAPDYFCRGLPTILLGGPAPDYFCRGLPAILLGGSAGLGCNTIEHLQKIFT